MLSRIKQYAIYAAILAVFFFLLSHHLIFIGTNVSLLRKNELTFSYTFFKITGKQPKDILEISSLRDAGIGQLMLKKGMISEPDLNKLLSEYE